MEILGRNGNHAVVALPGRRFPAVALQGDSFAILRTQVAYAARTLRSAPDGADALDELDDAVATMDALLDLYEQYVDPLPYRRLDR